MRVARMLAARDCTEQCTERPNASTFVTLFTCAEEDSNIFVGTTVNHIHPTDPALYSLHNFEFLLCLTSRLVSNVVISKPFDSKPRMLASVPVTHAATLIHELLHLSLVGTKPRP
jgi:hypothetical protein